MKNKASILLFVLITSLSINAAPQGDSFTYQGELTKNNLPVTGNYEFILSFWDASSGGAFLDSQNFDGSIPYDGTGPGIPVANGIFTLNVDIGVNQFINQEVWLSLDVSDDGGTSFLELLPRQLITNSPYAIESKYVGENGVTSLAIVDGIIIADDIDSDQIQERVTGTCIAGSSIRAIANDGSVTCETDDVGGGAAGWGLTGNAGTNPGANFIGTTDAKDVILKVNNNQIVKLEGGSNVTIGNSSNSISTTGGVINSSIGGGISNLITSTGSPNPANHTVIAGGTGNTITAVGALTSSSSVISGGFGNTVKGQAGTISGGSNNQVLESFGTISGGSNHIVTGIFATIPGGYFNQAGGQYSFAAGENAVVRNATMSGDSDGDENTFVWSSSSANFISTGPKQFLIDASGGVGIGTNDPKATAHIKGTVADINSSLYDVALLLEPTTTASPTGDDVNLVLSARGSLGGSGITFAKDKTKNFKMASVFPSATLDTLKFTHTDFSGTTSNFMSLEYDKSTVTKSVHMSVDLLPDAGSNIGSSTLRWSTIYAVNALNTPSDKRLKKNIVDLDYGLAEVLEMRPVSYHWKKGDTEKLNIGLIAQEVEKIVPEVVTKADDKLQSRSMAYSELIPVLIKATQEQQVLIEQLQAQIKELNNNQRNRLK